MMSGLYNDEDPPAPTSLTVEAVDLLVSMSSNAEEKSEDDGAGDDSNCDEDDFRKTVSDYADNGNTISTADSPKSSIAVVRAIVNEVRSNRNHYNYNGNSNSKSSFIPRKLEELESMEQGGDSRYYQDDPNSSPPVGVWKDKRFNYTFKNDRYDDNLQRRSRRYNFIGSLIRSKFCTYCIIITTLFVIGIITSVAVTEGFKHVRHRNELLHPKWQGDVNEQSKSDQEVVYTHHEKDISYHLTEAYTPIWFNRDSGWKGTSHTEAFEFCKSRDNFVPCPYNVYCPEDKGKKLLFDEEMTEADSWAPVTETNKWVQVGSGGGACSTVERDALVEKLTRHIMCCLEEPLDLGGISDGVGAQAPPSVENEDGVEDPIPPPFSLSSMSTNNNANGDNSEKGSLVNFLNPVWYGTDEWISGSYDDATHFCNFKGKELCPYAAYCPYGPGKAAIDGFVPNHNYEEQWAPIKSNEPNPNEWVLIGTMHDDPFTQCIVKESPSFGYDKSQSELKLHIMCCDKEQSSGSSNSTSKPVDDSIVSSSANDPVWYNSNDGWNGGSHESAIIFCLSKKKSLCPVETYCPHGKNSPPLTGQGKVGLDEDFEQWAPAIDKENFWIMVGWYEMDETTQCMDQDEILGKYPSWGLDGSNSEHKHHILCCPSAR